MLPVCSATTGCSSHSQISLHGRTLPFSSYQRTFKVRCLVHDWGASGLSSGIHLQSIATIDAIQDNLALRSDTVKTNIDSLSSVKSKFEDTISGITKSINASVNKGENALNNFLETITSSVTSVFKGVNVVVDDAVNKVNSAAEQTGEVANNKLSGFTIVLKEASGKVGIIAVNVLRRAVVVVEDSLTQGAAAIVYAYGSAKGLLPQEVQNILNSSEDSAMKILRPAGTAFGQAYVVLEGLEKTLGLDPNDPVVPFALFIGASSTLWVCYWALTYGGYAGDLSPELTLELLKGKENAVLIDVRPEDLRERDGIPDLRRTARFRYANVTLPEVDGSIRKLLKGGRDIDDSLIAAIIRNLKIVHDSSKVIVMDADGTRSKGIARSLMKLGVKRSYMVKGGFRSWVKQGNRIKELKPETTLTILNEEAEAILEDIKPTPGQAIGYGVGFIAAVYALLEWEKTLQLIGIFGLGQTLYQRVASYENAEDFKQDVRQLLAPVKLGSQAISWAASKIDTNLNGLPTSPSSSDIQNRVLQAAAKHESQPSEKEEIQDASPKFIDPVRKNVDLSEA